MDFIFEENVYSSAKTELFEEWMKYSKDKKISQLFQFVTSKFGLVDVTEESVREIKMKLARLSAKFSKKWHASGRSRTRFFANNKSWLEGKNIQFKVRISHPRPSTSSEGSQSKGRPKKSFEVSSFKTKKRKLQDLVQSRSTNELLTAAEVALRSSGQRDMARAIKEIHQCPEKVNVLKNVKPLDSCRQLSPDEALAYYVDSKSTTYSYKQTRKWTMKVGHNVFPSYHSLSKSKKSCLPADEHILVTETRAELQLQAVLNKTVERLVKAQSSVISTFSNSSFFLVSKWRCDGSSGHSTYKQKFETSDDTDEFMFLFSFVPIKLLDGKHVVWQNPRPSSTMYCRPIKFIFAKETPQFTVTETNKVLEEVRKLLPTICNVNDSQISVTHELLLTMTDGKVCNALTETRSSQTCYICGAKSKMMNDERKDFVSNEENFRFGLSTLHAWIRCFECLLHISYRLGIKKWQIRDKDDKTNVQQRTDEIKQRFKKEMGLIVDKPKPGFGSTNDGNTARRFFGNPELTSNITGLDVTLIKYFDILLRALSSGFEINLSEFQKLCLETRQLYLNLYSWYYMPVTVHKILNHSTEIIKKCLVPIGQLSEEAQEARNKDCRRFREHHTRKRSRITTNKDLLTMLLITSDPLINSLREIPQKKVNRFPSEVLKLLLPPKVIPSCLPDNPSESDDYLVSDSSEIDSENED